MFFFHKLSHKYLPIRSPAAASNLSLFFFWSDFDGIFSLNLSHWALSEYDDNRLLLSYVCCKRRHFVWSSHFEVFFLLFICYDLFFFLNDSLLEHKCITVHQISVSSTIPCPHLSQCSWLRLLPWLSFYFLDRNPTYRWAQG